MSDIIVTLTYTEAEAREVMRALHYFDSNVTATYEDHDRMNLIRSAIGRALPKPKPDEPQGLGAVVRDGAGRIYTRYETADGPTKEPQPWWQSANGPESDIVRRFGWEDIDVVEVLTEGVIA